MLQNDDRAVTIESVQKAVAEHYSLKVTELKSKNNSKSVALPRQIAMYLCKNLTNASLPEIGRSFGGKHHSTVIHSIRKIEDLRSRGRRFQHGYQQPVGVVPVSPIATISTADRRGWPVHELWVSGGPQNIHRTRLEKPAAVPQPCPQPKLQILNGLTGVKRVFHSTYFLL